MLLFEPVLLFLTLANIELYNNTQKVTQDSTLISGYTFTAVKMETENSTETLIPV